MLFTTGQKKGITLVELIIALALLTVILGMAYSFFSLGMTVFRKGAGQSDIQQNLRLTADIITREIRLASELQIIDPVTIPDTVSDEYRYVFVNSANSIEFKNKDGSKKFLDNGVNSMSVTLRFESMNSGKILGFALNASGENNYSIESEVYPLNLASPIAGNNNAAIAYKAD